MAIRGTSSPSVEPERHPDAPRGQRTWDIRACVETTVRIPVCTEEYTAFDEKDEEDQSPSLSGKPTVEGRGIPHKTPHSSRNIRRTCRRRARGVRIF